MKKGFFLTTVPQLQKGAIVSAIGFALFVAASALVPSLSGWVALVFAGVSLYVFWSLVLCAGFLCKGKSVIWRGREAVPPLAGDGGADAAWPTGSREYAPRR